MVKYLKEEVLDASSVYQSLTQNNKLKLTRVVMEQFLKNIWGFSGELEDKEIYTFDDILKLQIDEKQSLMHRCIGQKFFAVTNEYQFCINPFIVSEYDDFIEKSSHKLLTTLNNDLILNSGNIYENTIYVCLAENVLRETAHLSSDTTLKMYFPFLFENKITNLHELQTNRQLLIEKNKSFDNEKTTADMLNIDMFYKLYESRTSELSYIQYGIKQIKILLKPKYVYKVPLDVIFKLIHADELNPLIKYNSATKQERIYRLYADKISADGKKIPYLDKAEIFKLQRTIAKTKSVSVYIKYKTYNVICDFEDNGNIFISCDFGEIIQDISLINTIFQNSANIIIRIVKSFLQQNGYTIHEFDTIINDNVEIKQLKMQSIIKIQKDITFDNIMNCVSSIFSVESKKLSKGIVMRLKRVANFVNSTSQEAFVIDQQKNGLSMSEIKTGLIENFKMTDQSILELFAKLSSEEQIIQDVGKRKAELKPNPGFKTTLELYKEHTTLGKSPPLLITVDGITDLKYLETISVYIDSFIRLTQDSAIQSKMSEMCGKHILKNTPVIFKDLVSEAEEAYPDQIVHDIIDNELVDIDMDAFSDDDNPLFNFWDDNDETDMVEGKGPKKKVAFIEEEEEEEEEEKEEKEDDDDADESIKNIDGMKLNKPYYFQTLIEKKDPVLILKEDTPEFNAYSRTCRSDMRRQPVIITDSQLEKINKEPAGFLREEDVIKYGSNPKNKFNYNLYL